MTCHPRIASQSFPWRAVTDVRADAAIAMPPRIRTDNLRAGTHTCLLPDRHSYSAVWSVPRVGCRGMPLACPWRSVTGPEGLRWVSVELRGRD